MPAEHTGVYRYPLVQYGAADVTGPVTIVRRLAIARTLPEVMQITTQAARRLYHSFGCSSPMCPIGSFCGSAHPCQVRLADVARFLSCASDEKPFPWEEWPKAE